MTTTPAPWAADPTHRPWLLDTTTEAPGGPARADLPPTADGPRADNVADAGDAGDEEFDDELDAAYGPPMPAPRRAPRPSPTPRPRPTPPAPVPALTPAVGTVETGQQPVPDLGDLVRLRRDRPTRGWRGVAYTATRGLWNPGLCAVEVERRRLVDKTRTPLPGSRQIAVSSLKGGIGKTTVAAGLGLTLAEHRGDRIVALDANPDAGTLADRLTGHCGLTLRELIDNIDTIRSWTDIAHYTSLAGRLQVLASEQDPAMSEAFNRDEYEQISTVLARFFNIVITDSGTGLVHSAMAGALAASHTLVIVGAPTVDGASRAAKTLDWLIAHGHGDLVDRAVLALSCDRSSREVDRAAIVDYLQHRCHAVVQIPADPHLAIGGRIELAALRPATRDAFLEVAGAVAEQFTWDNASASAMGRGGFR